MKKQISLGQVWILEKMHNSSTGGVSNMLRTTGSPEPVRMPALRGLEKRGYCEERRTGLFYITEAGRKAYSENMQRLREFEVERSKKEQAQAAADDAEYYGNK